MDKDEKYDLIVRNTFEFVGDPEILKKILSKRDVKIYWGTAPTNPIHIGYYVPLLKIADFLKAGCQVTILIADLHAYLDNMKSSLEQLSYRTEYYTVMIKAILESQNIDITKLKFVIGSSFQMSTEYTMDVYKALSLTSLAEAKHAGSEVVKQSSNPRMNGLVYPMLQCLDEQYLDVDLQFGGVDQRKIFMMSRELHPKLKYKKIFHLMNEMVPGLRTKKNKFNQLKEDLLKAISESKDEKTLMKTMDDLMNKDGDTNSIQETKMSSSNFDSKIDMLDSKNKIKKKIRAAYCLPGEVDDNPPLVLLEKIIMLVNDKFVINRKEEHGGSNEYDDIQQVKNEFKELKLHPDDLKNGIIDGLNQILDPIRKVFSTKEMNTLVKMAYNEKFFKKNKNKKFK